MGSPIFVDHTGTVTITHTRTSEAPYANGLAIVSPVYEVLTTSASTTGESWTREFAPGSEIRVRLLPDGVDIGSGWNSTGAQAVVVQSTETTLQVQWENGDDAEFNDASTIIEGGTAIAIGAYIPRDIVVSYRPVNSTTVGTGVSRLNGTVSSNGTGVMIWCDHNTLMVYSAVVDPSRWLNNDVVRPEDVVVVANLSGEIAVYSVGIFSVGNVFYAIVHARRQGMLVNNEIYVSYDLGASWAYVTTYQAQGNPSSGHDGVFTSTPLSLPYITGNKWLWTSSAVAQGPANADRVPRVTVVESSNGGLSTVQRLNTGAGRFSLFTEHISSQIVQDPMTGDLYLSTGGSGSSIDSWYLYRSTDGGASWPAVINFGNGSNYYIPFAHDGRYMYALRYYGGIYRMVNPLVQSTWQYAGASGGASGHGRFNWVKNRAHFFNYGDQVWTSGGGWQVGSLAFG